MDSVEDVKVGNSVTLIVSRARFRIFSKRSSSLEEVLRTPPGHTLC